MKAADVTVSVSCILPPTAEPSPLSPQQGSHFNRGDQDEGSAGFSVLLSPHPSHPRWTQTHHQNPNP